jgi:hypothetical protein
MQKFNLLRTLDSIISNGWGDYDNGNVIFNQSPPIFDQWDYDFPLEIKDVKIWEQLYHEKGIFGLFVSWNPYIEFYLLVFYTIENKDKKFKTFYGPDACYEVKKILENYKIDLELNDILSSTPAHKK